MKSVFCKDIDIIKIMKKVSKFDCIFFDVFDTLIKRNVKKPTDLYDLIASKIETEFGYKSFGAIRYNSEMSLYKTQKNVTLDNIYDEIQKRTSISKHLIQKFKCIEIEYELSYCQCNYYMKEVYNYAKLLNKKIIAISDMYLPRKIIEQMLIKCGYDISSIYVSCEYFASKKKGLLFDIAINKENLNSKNILHIGDSFLADYLGAKKCGISSIKIQKNPILFNTKKFTLHIKQKFKYNVHECVINNNLYNCKSYFEKFGFSILGPTLYSFCRWIENECRKQNISTIYFFSRDGYIIKKAFDAMSIKGIESRYLYVSRRALRVPYNASHFELHDIINLLPNTKLIKIETMFEYLDLNIDDYKCITDEFGIDKNTIIYHHEISGRYYPMLKRLLPDYISKAKAELEHTINYLRQECVTGKIAIVDIGWHNSMQYCIEALLNENNIKNELFGFYFGIQSNGFKLKNAKGFITEPNGNKYVDSTAAYIGLIESFFLEQKGSVLKYEFFNNKYVPVRAAYEYEKNSKEYKAYADMHQGVLKYIKIFCSLIENELLSLNGTDAYLPIRYFGIQPYIADIDKFEQFRYFSEGTYYLIGYKGILHYLFHIKDLKKDLYNARWKIGFLKKIFKINLPYYNLYMYLKRR